MTTVTVRGTKVEVDGLGVAVDVTEAAIPVVDVRAGPAAGAWVHAARARPTRTASSTAGARNGVRRGLRGRLGRGGPRVERGTHPAYGAAGVIPLS